MMFEAKLTKNGITFELQFDADCETDAQHIVETASLMHDEPSKPTVIVSIKEVAATASRPVPP